MVASQTPRRPAFLAGAGAGAPKAAAPKKGDTSFRPPVIGSQAREAEESRARAAAAATAEAQKQASRFTERTAAAVEALRQAGERLAEEARSDAMEIGFLVARRILEAELVANSEALVNLVRTAVKRLGESRRIVVHLSTADAQAVQAVLESRGASALTQASAARIDIVPDPSLGRGDCLIEGDLVAVDGRMQARIEELRRVIETGVEES